MTTSRIVGVDFGLARLGLAVSDPTKMIAFPLITLECDKKSEKTAKKFIDYLQDYCQKNKTSIEKIVLGMPLMMSGKKGFLADEVNHFIHELSLITQIPIETWDERLTTVQAEKSLKEGTLTRKKRTKYVDTVSAVLILQNYLDAKRFFA